RRCRRHAGGPVGVVYAGGILALQVHLEVAGTPRGYAVDGRRVTRARNAGREDDEAEPVADAAARRAAATEIERKIVDLVALDVHALLAILGLQQGSFRGNRHALR